MGRYTQTGRRNRTGRRVLPLLFCMMLALAACMTAQKITPSLSGDVLVIRDRGETDSYIPAEAVPETGEADVPPDRVITGSYAEAVSHRTSFRLDAETGNDPVETLPSLRSDTDYASQAAPPRVIGQLERIPAESDYATPVPEGEPQPRE